MLLILATTSCLHGPMAAHALPSYKKNRPFSHYSAMQAISPFQLLYHSPLGCAAFCVWYQEPSLCPDLSHQLACPVSCAAPHLGPHCYGGEVPAHNTNKQTTHNFLVVAHISATSTSLLYSFVGHPSLISQVFLLTVLLVFVCRPQVSVQKSRDKTSEKCKY